MVDKKRVLALFFFSIFFVSLVSASFSVGKNNWSLEKIYGPEDNITGWVNMSFSSEPLDSTFVDSRENSVNLSTVLKNNAVYTYTCNPKDCGNEYSVSNPTSEKTSEIDSGSSKIYGVKLTGNIFNIDTFKFTVESNAAPSCTNQIEIDLFDDSTLDARNSNVGEAASCTNLKDDGCYSSNQTQEEFTIGTTPYCEKVVLASSPGFLIGGWVKKVSGNRTIKASLYNVEGGAEITSCILPDASAAGSEISCSINQSVVNLKEYYVCLQSTSGSGDYKTKGYSISNGCGFFGTPVPSSKPSAYDIFAQGKQFGSVGALNLNKSVSDGKNFQDLAESYIIKKYGSLNCTLGCVIPIKVNAKSDQDITIKNVEIIYQKESGLVTENNVYDVSKVAAKVTSNYQRLYLDGSGFSVPENLGNYTFSLALNSQSVLSEKVEVKDVPIIKAITPSGTASAFPTEFTASVSSKYNLTKYVWNFGDGTAEVQTTGRTTTHTYNSSGVYNLKITVTDQRQLSASKIFTINVTSAKDLINSTLVNKEKDIANLDKEIMLFPLIYQEALKSTLNTTSIKQRLTTLRSSYQSASSEAQYNSIITELVRLNIPEGISKTRSASSITLFSGPDYVDMDIVHEIGGGNYSSSDESGYVNGVLLWQQENLDVSFDYNEFSGRYDGYVEPITRVFEIDITERRDISYDYYLILPELEGFTANVPYTRESGYIYIELQGKDSVSFSTTEDIDFTSLPAFISPAISRLTIAEGPATEEGSSRWLALVLVIIVLMVITVIVYIFMQEWYRKKYELHLFPNKNDLYNMVNYVHQAQKRGMKHHDIESNLKRVGWSAERIRYVMRKYAGKATGMLEIPIRKFIEKTDDHHHPPK